MSTNFKNNTTNQKKTKNKKQQQQQKPKAKFKIIHYTCVLSAIAQCIGAQCYSFMNKEIIIEGLNTGMILS